MDAASEPVPDLSTLADLPFHVLGRHPKPLLVGRCVKGAISGLSTRDWFDRLRDLSLVLAALGIAKGDRVAIMSESRPEWLLADLAILSQDIFTVPDDRLPETVSLMTMVGGRITYDAGVLSPAGAPGAARPTRPQR